MTKVKNIEAVTGTVEEVAKKVTTMTKLNRALGKVTYTTNKHLPLILTATAFVTMGAAVYTSYKSRAKVEAIVSDAEQRQLGAERLEEYRTTIEDCEEVNTVALDAPQGIDYTDLIEQENKGKLYMSRVEYTRRIAGAVALPTVLALVSTGALAGSYIIQNKRLQGLATALAGAVAERKYFRQKFENDYGKQELEKFETEETKEITEVNAKGKEVTKKTTVRANTAFNSLSGRWFADSTEFTSDDHEYNLDFLRSKQRMLENKLFERGYLSFNEVLDAVGFDRVKGGSDLGYNTASGFDMTFQTTNFQTTDDIIPQIYVRWTHPVSIYHDVDYNGGRYSI